MNAQLIKSVIGVMNDGSRIDRWLSIDADGELYLTTRNEADRQVFVPVNNDSGVSDYEDEENAIGLIESAKDELS